MDRATISGGSALMLWALLALLSRAASSVLPFQLAAMAFAVSGGLGLAWLAVSSELRVLRVSPLAWAHGVGGLFGYGLRTGLLAAPARVLQGGAPLLFGLVLDRAGPHAALLLTGTLTGLSLLALLLLKAPQRGMG